MMPTFQRQDGICVLPVILGGWVFGGRQNSVFLRCYYYKISIITILILQICKYYFTIRDVVGCFRDRLCYQGTCRPAGVNQNGLELSGGPPFTNCLVPAVEMIRLIMLRILGQTGASPKTKFHCRLEICRAFTFRSVNRRPLIPGNRLEECPISQIALSCTAQNPLPMWRTVSPDHRKARRSRPLSARRFFL